MRKLYLTLCIFVFLAEFSFSQGNFMTKEKAQLVAEKFYFERNNVQAFLSFDKIKITDFYTIKENNNILYYVFNIAPSGFVAVSAYDGITPILFYSFKGNYQSGSQPENFAAWADQYARQISYALSTKVKGNVDAIELWDYYLSVPVSSMNRFSGREVLPMLTSNWDQGVYYNAMCPEDPAGPAGHCVTGCVATALGQLLNYFRWPQSGIGSYTYDCPNYGTLSVDFSAADYNYDLMVNSVEQDNQEVAELIYNLGVSVDMQYGPDGSGMYNHKAAYTLKTYFKYSPETQYVFRDSTTMDWDSLIISHLDRKIPLYYAGWSVPNINGHAFICDGYQGENYYHFNWGWSGSNDGYFYTDNLTPGGNNFNLAQELVINAVPDTNLYEYPVQCTGDKTYDALFGTIDDGSGPLYGYANGAGCSWLITPNDSVTGITLNFHRFGTAEGDSVKVFDGTDETAPLLGSFSGTEIPASVSATGGSMFITFNSDSGSVSDGFLASFESGIPVYCSGMVMMTEQTDTLADGSGTWNYHNGEACLWRIIPTGATSVTLFFTEFGTEAGFDILKIYDLQTGQVLAEYSGTYESGVPYPVTSPSGKMFLSFSTNPTNTAPGWTAYYESNLVGVGENSDINSFLVFPNPAKEYVTILQKTNNTSEVKLTLTDLSGRQVFNSEWHPENNKSIKIELSNFTSGIYILETRNDKGNTGYYKIVKD